MVILTIPKKLTRRDDLVVIPRREYEALIELRKIREFVPTAAQKKALAGENILPSMSSGRDWALRVRMRVWKDIAVFPRKDRERLSQIIEDLARNPYVGDIEKMRGEENTWRRRVGAFRIFYELFPQEKVIFVFHVERRTSKTY